MNVTSNGKSDHYVHRRYASLDFARGVAIVGMIVLHMISDLLDIDNLLADLGAVKIINILALVILPFYGGLAGFFLLISSMGNMFSMYRDLEKGKSVRSLVLKQIVGGIILLFFAMLSEGLIGYHAVVGSFFNNLNNPLATNWSQVLWRWNYFETVHTIAWCLIINGIVQGLLSLKNNWQNRRDVIKSYVILIVFVLLLTTPIWTIISKYVGPGYPWGQYPEGQPFHLPKIGSQSFWHILRAPFLNALAAPWEPIFPYLAVSFVGSIFGIILSQPKEKINRKFPRNAFLGGLAAFVIGTAGVVIIVINVMSSQGFDTAINFYREISNHRAWFPDRANYIPPFAWLAQFISLNGFSIMLVAVLFRIVEFRGKAKIFADRTRIIRRFGVIAFTNYNNQFLYSFVFFITSLMLTRVAYQKLLWAGVFLSIFLTLLLYHGIMILWEKIGYIGSLEWTIRTITNNAVPARRANFPPDMKWWQRGQVKVQETFYQPEWIDLKDTYEINLLKTPEMVNKETSSVEDSKFALILSIVGACSILFMVVSIFAIFVTFNSRKTEGKNKYNKAALVLSIVGLVLLVGLIIASLIISGEMIGLDAL
jgi:hypothetical protein